MTGFYIPVEIDRRVREAARNRCGYCLSPQELVMARLEIEHIIPRSAFDPDDPVADDESNLWLACPLCNGHKSNKTTGVDPETDEPVALFNPRTQIWSDHFRWSEDGIRIIGLAPVGRATARALRLADDPDALLVRANWVIAGWHPPD